MQLALSSLYVPYEAGAFSEFEEFRDAIESLDCHLDSSALYAISFLNPSTSFISETSDNEESFYQSEDYINNQSLSMSCSDMKQISAYQSRPAVEQSGFNPCEHSSISHDSNFDSDSFLESSEHLSLSSDVSSLLDLQNDHIQSTLCVIEGRKESDPESQNPAFSGTVVGDLHQQDPTSAYAPMYQKSTFMEDLRIVQPDMTGIAVGFGYDLRTLRSASDSVIPSFTSACTSRTEKPVNTSTKEGRIPSVKKPRNRHPPKALAVLNEYFAEHLACPYPSRRETRELAERAGITVKKLRE